MTGGDAVDQRPAEGAQSLRRALSILRLVAAGQDRGVRMTDVVNASGLSRPTTQRILRVLTQEGFVEQDESTRRYLIGDEVPLLGMARLARFPERKIAQPFLHELSQALGDTTFLTIRKRDDSVCLAREPGSYPIKVLSIEVGTRRPLGVGVSGLVLLASLHPDEARRITARNDRHLRELGMLPEDVLARAFVAAEDGFAYAPVGVVPGTRSVAVPVRDGSGKTVAGITLTAIADRLTEQRLCSVIDVMQQRAHVMGLRWSGRMR